MSNFPDSIANELDKKGYLIIKKGELDRLREVAALRPEILIFVICLNNKLNKSNFKKLDKWSLLNLIEEDLIKLVAQLNESGYGKEGEC
jgi:hypothetical protein